MTETRPGFTTAVARLDQELIRLRDVIKQGPPRIDLRTDFPNHERYVADQFQQLAERIEDSRTMIGKTLRKRQAEEGAAFAVMSSIQAIETDASTFPDLIAVETDTADPRRLREWFRDHIGPILRRLAAWLWQAISRMLTPRGWKFTGTLGSGGLGFPDASIEVNFGQA
jgi:hypothetical protein